MTEAIKKITFKHVFGSMMILYFGVVIYSLVFMEIPESNREVYVHMLGILEGVVVTIGSYYFGSSSGSKAKTEILEKNLKEENKPQ